MALPGRQGLYDPRNEHDSCGVGFVANIKGRKSHDLIARGLQILVNLDHRGAVGADPLVGDGAGCLIQMPDALLRDWANGQGLTLPAPGRYAVAMCFLPADPQARAIAVGHFEHFIAAEGQRLVGWRDVPTDTTGLGARVVETMPWISQAIVACGSGGRRSGCVRAQDPDHPQADPEQRRGAGRAARHAGAVRFLHAVVLDPHRRLQGAAAGAAGRQLLPGSAQSADGLGPGAGPSALFDQHLSRRGASPTRTGSCATTARSTRCAATSTGCMRAARR